MTAILDYFQYIGSQLKNITFIDVLDILICAAIFYYVFMFMRKRRAGKLLVGILLLLLILFLSSVLDMKGLNFILTNLFSVGVLSLIILFQPELRSFLEKVGGTRFVNFKSKLVKGNEESIKNAISEICIAADHLSASKTGALIVFERKTKLGDQIRTGTVINADVSSYLLENIFFNKAPLHDGAVIISKGRIDSAGCYLPLSTNNDIIKELGTRHRAGIGMSENSDAVVLIVSEETGVISVAVEGELTRDFTRNSLESKLYELLLSDDGLTDKVVDKVKGSISKKGGKKS